MRTNTIITIFNGEVKGMAECLNQNKLKYLLLPLKCSKKHLLSIRSEEEQLKGLKNVFEKLKNLRDNGIREKRLELMAYYFSKKIDPIDKIKLQYLLFKKRRK